MEEWLEVSLRCILAISVLFLFTRILGKKQIAQLTFFEYIVGITIGDIAGSLSINFDTTYHHAILALAIWILSSLLIEFITMKSKTVRDWVEGKETILIKDGQILENNLKKERINADELLEKLRSKNAFLASDVEFAVLESDGELNVLLKKEHQSITPAMLGIKMKQETEPKTVLMDGEILEETLSDLNLNVPWLMEELRKKGCRAEQVYLAQVDSLYHLHIDTYDDPIPEQDVDHHKNR